MNILAVGAHPDDFEIGCYGTLVKHDRNGDKIFGLTLTKGEMGGNSNERRKEALDSAKLINMELEFGVFRDGSIPHDISTISFIEEYIEKNKIDIVYSTSIHERHQDHRNIGLSMLVSGRNCKEVYAFETISCTNEFNPTMFVNISDVIDVKQTGLGKHKSQEHRLYVENYDSMNRYRALKIGFANKHFESFEVLKIVR